MHQVQFLSPTLLLLDLGLMAGQPEAEAEGAAAPQPQQSLFFMVYDMQVHIGAGAAELGRGRKAC